MIMEQDKSWSSFLCTFMFDRVHVFAKVEYTIEVRQRRLNSIESESLLTTHTKATTATHVKIGNIMRHKSIFYSCNKELKK